MEQDYIDERYCHHCEDYTPHICYDDGHERDSSWDYQKCQICKWVYYGITGEYEPSFDAEE